MTTSLRWIRRFSPALFLAGSALEDACPDNADGVSDVVELLGDLVALNRSSGNKLHEIRRVPCTGDGYYSEEPVILEGCCWAMESAFQKGGEVADCSNDEDFLPLDHFNFSHSFFLEHCGDEDLIDWHEQDFFQATIAKLASKPDTVRKTIEDGLRDDFNVTLEDFISTVSKRHTMSQYSAEKTKFQVLRRPKTIFGYFNPLIHGAMKPLWCDAMKEKVNQKDLPVLSLYRQLSQFSRHQKESRRKLWEETSISFVLPKATTAVPAHLHFQDPVAAVLLTEGKKHWQLMESTAESFSDMQPHSGGKRWSQSFKKLPVDLADDYPVYVGTQMVGDVIILPRNWVHFVYSLEDSVSIVFSG